MRSDQRWDPDVPGRDVMVCRTKGATLSKKRCRSPALPLNKESLFGRRPASQEIGLAKVAVYVGIGIEECSGEILPGLSSSNIKFGDWLLPKWVAVGIGFRIQEVFD